MTAVTLRVDPSGYFLYWTDQNEVVDFHIQHVFC